MTDKICCIFNIAPHYNAPIYKLMDKDLDCDFYIGNRLSYTIKLMEYNTLTNFKRKLNYKKLFGAFYWQNGSVSLAFQPYTHYIMTGEPYCISSWIILFLNKLTGRKTYLWTHGWYGNETGIKKLIKKAYFGLSSKVFLYGNYARNLMIKQGLDENKLILIYNSLDYDKQISIRNKIKSTHIYQNHFNNKYPILLYIGRIQNRKKLELLINALKELVRNKTFCNLIFIGQETDKTRVKDLVALFQLEKYIWFYGPCYDEYALSELIYNADVCVSPGNVGLTAMHSLVYGTPVITQNNFAHQMPEFEAVEPEITGDFFIEDSVKDLTDKIKKWTSLNVAQREEVRLKCYAVIDSKYNPHRQINILKGAIND